MNMKLLPMAARHVLHPMGKLWWCGVAFAAGSTVWAGRVSGIDGGACLYAAAAWLVVFGSWYGRVKLRQYVRWRYWKEANMVQPTTERCWIAFPLLAVLAALVLSGTVWRLFFIAHLQSFEGLAARMMSKPDGTAIRLGRIGLYSDCEAARDGNRVQISHFWNGPEAAGVYYAPDVKSAPESARHLWGPWYEWSY
ncbi:hypothetical protein [Humisphaera borealis]|nr:hypothetical protein [Humisphaera borealis]